MSQEWSAMASLLLQSLAGCSLWESGPLCEYGDGLRSAGTGAVS